MGNRVGDLQDIACKKLIYATKRIRKERVKGWMGNPKELLQVLWEHVFMEKNPRMYVPITHYTDEEIIMVTQFLRQF